MRCKDKPVTTLFRVTSRITDTPRKFDPTEVMRPRR